MDIIAISAFLFIGPVFLIGLAVSKPDRRYLPNGIIYLFSFLAWLGSLISRDSELVPRGIGLINYIVEPVILIVFPLGYLVLRDRFYKAVRSIVNSQLSDTILLLLFIGLTYIIYSRMPNMGGDWP